jgi:hypothetical protein
VGIYFEFDVKATAVNFLHDKDATVSQAVRRTHVQGCLVFIYQCVGQVIFRCQLREALAKAFARFVFKHEVDFAEEVVSHLLKKTVFQFLLRLLHNSVCVEGVLSVALINFYFAQAVVVILAINVEGLLEHSEVVVIVGSRQQVLLFEVVDWRKPAKPGV